MQAAVQPTRRKGNGALGARMDFIGSPTNLVMIFTDLCICYLARELNVFLTRIK
jgi:photosystem I subunit 10